jgi:acyl-CoA thioester hydrolase
VSRAALPTQADFPFWSEEKVRISDTDHNGHVNNTATGQYCEAGRGEMMLQVAGSRGAGRGFAMAVARVAIDYRREIHWPGRVRVGTRVARIGTSSVTVAQALFWWPPEAAPGAPGTLFATAESVMVIMDPHTRRSMPMPEALRERFAALAGPVGLAQG